MRNLTKFINKILKIFSLKIISLKDNQDFYLHRYKSHSEYKQTQILYNIQKIKNIWADKKTLDRVAKLVNDHSKPENLKLGICHGARNGFEQNYLNSLNKKIYAIGTDISESCKKFKNSVQWDFHNHKKAWVRRFDFVYTNSLDQAWNPKKAISTWLNQIKDTGQIIIEHTNSHGPEEAGSMDPFGVHPKIFPYVLTLWFGDNITIFHTVDKKDNMSLDAWLFVIKKTRTKRKKTNFNIEHN
jgi:hypothetical protein